jgi:hypothetical protein
MRELAEKAQAALAEAISRGAPKEFTREDMLPDLLESAKRGLRRKSIDEAHELIRLLERVPPDNWPSQVLAWQFKRREGRMRSAEADAARFWQNPVKVAALLAQAYAARLRKENGGRFKLELSPGRKLNVRKVAVMLAVDRVNASLAKASRGRHRKVNEMAVEALLKKGKIRPPAR